METPKRRYGTRLDMVIAANFTTSLTDVHDQRFGCISVVSQLDDDCHTLEVQRVCTPIQRSWSVLSRNIAMYICGYTDIMAICGYTDNEILQSCVKIFLLGLENSWLEYCAIVQFWGEQ